MNSRFFKLIFLSFAMCLLVAVPASAVTIGGATVEASALNLRAEAGIQSDVRQVIPSGAFVVVEEQAGSWYKVCYNGFEGYISGEYANFAVTMDGSFTGKGTVKGSSVRIRAGASLDAKVVGYANTGDKFDIVGVSGEWVRIKYGMSCAT